MTDNEIIKALECCIEEDCPDCDSCPYDDYCSKNSKKALKDWLDLFNRQKAEIERLEEFLREQKRKFIRKRKSTDELAEKYVESLKQIKSLEELIETKTALLTDANYSLLTAKSEAYKEFAKGLKAEYDDFDAEYEMILPENIFKTIDDLLKEMVGEDNA